MAAIPAAAALPAEVRRAVAAAAAAAVPREACGALFGGVERATGAAPVLRIAAFAALANLAAGADRFACDPIELVAVEARMRGRGLALLGFAHSHPGGTATPSATDRAELWRGCLHLIAVPSATGPDALRAWYATRDGAFHAVPLLAARGAPA